jgi:hypothetical protein
LLFEASKWTANGSWRLIGGWQGSFWAEPVTPQ